MYEVQVWFPLTPLNKECNGRKPLKQPRIEGICPLFKGATTDSLYRKELGDIHGKLLYFTEVKNAIKLENLN